MFVYFADLVSLIRRKYALHEKMYKIEALKKRMPLYKRVIHEEIKTYGEGNLGLRKDLEIIVNDLDARQSQLRNDRDDLFVFNDIGDEDP